LLGLGKNLDSLFS